MTDQHDKKNAQDEAQEAGKLDDGLPMQVELPPYNGPKRRLTIVVEDTLDGPGKRGFNMFLDGDKERVGKVSEAEFGPAEMWGSQLFVICMDVLEKAGAITGKVQRS